MNMNHDQTVNNTFLDQGIKYGVPQGWLLGTVTVVVTKQLLRILKIS